MAPQSSAYQIVSASRRTDIPAFYSEWFMRRVRAGFCEVSNPLNSRQISRITLDPETTVLVFWTRWAAPMLRHLAELDARGYGYYFLYTLTGYPSPLEPVGPRLDRAIEAFARLAQQIGPHRVLWRYDPIVLTTKTNPDFHLHQFSRLATALRGQTHEAIVSFMDPYQKAARRLDALARRNPDWRYRSFEPETDGPWLNILAQEAQNQGMSIQSCASRVDLSPFNIPAGRCIDDQRLLQLLQCRVSRRKDPGQRAACGCVASRDIGSYDSCLFGCAYCYATRSFELAARRHAAQDPDATMLGPTL